METFIILQKEAEKLDLIINTNKTKYMEVTRKTNIIKQDIEVAGKFYEVVNQFIYVGSQINSKSLIKEGPPLWSSGQSFWLHIQRSRVRSPALPDFLSSSGSGTGSTQPREPHEVN